MREPEMRIPMSKTLVTSLCTTFEATIFSMPALSKRDQDKRHLRILFLLLRSHAMLRSTVQSQLFIFIYLFYFFHTHEHSAIDFRTMKLVTLQKETEEEVCSLSHFCCQSL